MNDNILNRIVEEFYNTGRLVLNELDDIPDELKILGTEAQLKIKKELDDILRKAKHTDKNAAYKKSKEYYEQFLIDVQQLLDKSEYEKQIEFVEEQLKMIDNILDYKKEKTEFEKSIDNLEDLEIGTKTSKTLYNVNTDKIIEIFQSNECLYNE